MNEFSNVPPSPDVPPIPPPSGDLCPVCHAVLQGRPKLCPNCGAVLAQVLGGTSCWISLATFFMVMLALGFGGTGACFMMLRTLEGNSKDTTTSTIIAFCFVAMLACGWAVYALSRRKK